MVTNNYKVSMTSNTKICFLVMLDYSCRSAREALVHLGHSGDMTDGAATIRNIASHQAEKRALDGFTSLFKILWSGEFYP